MIRWLCALTLVTSPAAAQDPRITARFPADVAARIDAVIDSAQHERLPTEPLVLRALEGSTKGATPDRIVRALSRLRGALQTARTTLGPAAGAAELTIAAGALEAGVATARLVELRRLRAGQTLTAPLGAYLDLIARGAAPDRAWNRIADLARHRAVDAEYLKLAPTDINPDPPSDDPDDPPDQSLWTLSTGGGQAQLDHMPSGAISAMGGTIAQPLGATTFHFAGTTSDHAGLGATGVMGGELRYAAVRHGWQFDGGPTFASGRDIGSAWTNAAGVRAQVTRQVGAWSFFGALRGGVAWGGSPQNIWGGHAMGAEFHVAGFRFTAAWRGTTAADSNQTTALVVDTIPVPDSVPRPPGGISVYHGYDTTWHRTEHDLHDLALSTSWSRGAVSLRADAGQRLGVAPQGESWWMLGATLRVTSTVGISVASGRTLSDQLLGLRGERSTTVGLHLSTPQRSMHLADRTPEARVEVWRESASEVRLVLMLPEVEHDAAIASDATDWRSIALFRRADGRWEATLVAGPGVYRINLRHDGGAWQVPPGLPATEDGFGGRVGLLVLP